METRGIDRRVLAGLLALSALVHFVPFERPGFQPDDHVWLQLARAGGAEGLNLVGLTQGARPLGSTLFMALPYFFGLREDVQIAALIGITSALTALVYAYLAGLLKPPLAALASILFVLWPVKHEIYASQLFIVNNLAACLIVASGLAYRRWCQGGRRSMLALAVLLYGTSMLIYELGYLAPIVFFAVERSRARADVVRGTSFFLAPALLYWLLRMLRPEVVITIGRPQISLESMIAGALSIPSNIAGFQLGRNLGYGLWGLWQSPLALSLLSLALCAVVTAWVLRLRRQARESGESLEFSWRRAAASLAAAILLMAPAGLVLVESRHSVLAAAPIAVAVATAVVRMPRFAGVAATALLLSASSGLAFRQAQVSELQAVVHSAIASKVNEIASARAVVYDVGSLARRIDYTWGSTDRNVLRSYWGLVAFSPGGFRSMTVNLDGIGRPFPRVGACGVGLVATKTEIRCAEDLRGSPFRLPAERTLIITFDALSLPSSIPERRNEAPRS